MIRVSVIVPVYRHWQEAATCLGALAAQDFPADQMEIIAVNNDPDTPPPPGFELPANARLVDQPKPGSYAARNAGLAVARGDILCFTDADCTPHPGWVSALVARLDTMGPLARVGGRVELAFGSGDLTTCEFYEKHFGFRQDRYIGEYGWSVTANLGTTRATFDQVGPFDDARLSSGDKDWGLRASAAGVPIVLEPAAVVSHPARADWGDLIRKQRRLVGGKLPDKLKKRGRARMIASYLVSTPFRVLPLTAFIRRVILGKGTDLEKFGLADRWRFFKVYYVMRLVRVQETGRLLFTGAKPERR